MNRQQHRWKRAPGNLLHHLTLGPLLAVLVLVLCPRTGTGAGPTEAARSLLEELAIRVAGAPVRHNSQWRAPERILVLSSWAGELPPRVRRELESAAGGAELVFAEDVEALDAGTVASVDVLLGRCTAVRPEMKRLRWVQHFSAGVESCIRHEGLLASGAMLTNMKGVYGPGIAEHVMAMMLSLTRGLHRFHHQQAGGNWHRALARKYPMQEVKGKTMLVVGLGGIGTEIAWRAHGLGMRVIATRNSRREGPAYVDYVGLADELLPLAGEADIVVNATPLTPSTQGLFDGHFFRALRPSAYFINIGRGKSVVTDELVAALKQGRLAGAALDVTDPEPLPPDHALWRMPDVIITPHISASSDQVRQRFWIFVRENLRRYVRGEAMLNVVDMQKGY